MKKSLLFAFVITIVGSCIISCGSKEEERPWRYDIDYTDTGSYGPAFKGKHDKHWYTPYANIPNTCSICQKGLKAGNHYDND